MKKAFATICVLMSALQGIADIHAGFGVGNFDGTVLIERVAVSNDGRLYAWDGQGNVIPAWPKDLTDQGRVFTYGPRMTDIDLDQRMEVVAVSENKNGGGLRLYVYKGNGAELPNWGFSIPDSNLAETPIVADINRDSSPEIIYATLDGRVRVFRRGFRELASFGKNMEGFSHLSIGDPDNDGLDNLFAASGGAISTWDENGNIREFYRLPAGEETIGSVVIEDLTRDDYPELVFATSAGRIIAIDQHGNEALAIKVPAGANIASAVIVDDMDIDKMPELVVATGTDDVIAFKLNGEMVSSWSYKLGYREPSPISGVIANDLYRGLFSSITGFDQNSVYRTRHNSYSRIRLGENVREWDDFANFDFLEMIEVFDLFSTPKPFTPNGDGVNDVAYIHYRLSGDALVSLDLYDAHEKFISKIGGKEWQPAGEHQLSWTGLDTKGTATTNDDTPLDTGLYLIKVVAESMEGFVTQATLSAIINGVKAEIEIPEDDDESDNFYPQAFGKLTISGIATDPNFGEDNLDADFASYKLYYRPGVWTITNEEVVLAGSEVSQWRPCEVPLRHQCPGNENNEPNDLAYPRSNVSCRPVQHGVLGHLDTTILKNGEYTLLLKVMDSNGNAVGKVNYDTLVVTIANAVEGDPFDAGNPFDPNNPNNPKFKGPSITNARLSNTYISRQNPATTITYTLEGETSNVHITVFSIVAGSYGTPVAVYSFNYQAPNDTGNPTYDFVWNGTTSLGRNVNGGAYGIRIEANAVDGTGVATNDSLTLNVAKGYAASDTLGIAKDPQSGAFRFTATPSHFNPLEFGTDLESEKTYLSYELTKEAKVTIQALEDIAGQGLVVRKTISSGKIRKNDGGAEFWDGTGDNGLVLPVGRDYIVRLTAEGIDIGNEETIYHDITVHLDSTVIDGSITANIAQLKGDNGVTVNKNEELRAITGDPDFLWRASATGYVSMPFSYTIRARGTDVWPIPQEIRETYQIYGQKFHCGHFDDVWGDDEKRITTTNTGHVAPRFTDLALGKFEAASIIEEISVYFNPDNDMLESSTTWLFATEEGRNNPVYNTNSFGQIDIPTGSATRTASTNIASRGLSRVYIIHATPDVDFDALDQCRHYESDSAHFWEIINSGALRYNYGDPNHTYCGEGILTDIWECGSVTVVASYHLNETRNWGPYGSSGSNTIISTSTNPLYYFATYSGQFGNGGASPVITSSSLTISNRVNGYPSSWSSDGSTISLPGLQAWLTGTMISAQVPLTTYSTIGNDPYLQNAPYGKIWGSYRNFNEEYYRRTTDNISLYHDGYRANIFAGGPGRNLYSFSDVVHLDNWNIEVRYPNITVSKPNGDNALNTGDGHLDVFAINNLYVTPAGTRGYQNSNIEDYFNLRLLPLAVPKTFVEIRGSAAANYELYYYDATEANPKWRPIEPRTRNPVNNGLLAHWDVTGLNGENYTVVLKAASGSNVNQDTFNIGIGERVETSELDDDEFVRVYTPFKRASLIFGKDSLPAGEELVTINPVRPQDADYDIPSGITPLGPIFDIKPDNIEINPDHHVQLEITYTPSELTEAFGVADASELTIYNLAGDGTLEGLATIITFDDMDDDDPTNDVYRFTATLEHFSQYFLARKIAGYFHIDSPAVNASLHGVVTIAGRIEDLPRPSDNILTPKPLANLTALSISYYPKSDSSSKTLIYSADNPTPTTSFSEINTTWDVSALNGNYVIEFDADGPQGSHSRFEIPVTVDNTPALSTLFINGVAVPDGGEVNAAGGAVLEMKTVDYALDGWQSGVKEIWFGIDGEEKTKYMQPINLWLSGGPHIIGYYAIDNNNNLEGEKSAIITIQEKMEPARAGEVVLQMSINGPSYTKDEQTWVNNESAITISAGGGNVADIKYRLGDAEYLIYNGPVQIESQAEGQYILEYFAIDTLGLRSRILTRPLILDITPPEISYQITGLHNFADDELVVTPTTRIALAASDLGNPPVGLGRIEYKFGDNLWNVYSEPVLFSQNGRFYYRAVDRLGNEGPEYALDVKLDDAAPVFGIVSAPSVISPNGDGRFDTAEFVVNVSDNIYEEMYLSANMENSGGNYNVFDNAELRPGLNKLVWDGKIGGQLIPEGVYNCEIRVTDVQGNASERRDLRLIYDVTPPEIGIINGTVRNFSPNGDDSAEILQVDYNISDNLFADGISIVLKLLTLGESEIARAVDIVGTPPANHSISWNGTNAMENGAFDGDYKFELVAEDGAGNQSIPGVGQGEEASSGEVFVDRYAPETVLKILGPNHDDGGKLWLGEGALIDLSATDPIPPSGLDKIFYSYGDEPQRIYTGPFALPAESIDYRLHYNAIDMVGNSEERHTKEMRLDITEPRTEISVGEPKESDDNGRVFIAPATRISLTSEDPDGVGVDTGFIEIEGSKAPSPYSEEFDLNGLGDGRYKILYWAKDLLGNTEPKHTIELNLDKTPPVTEIEIGEPKYIENEITYVTSNTAISFVAHTDRDDLQKTEYKIDDGGWMPAGEFTLAEEREYSISYRSFDRLQNVEPVNIKRIIVDNSPPEVGIGTDQTATGGGGNYVTPTTMISLSGTDSGAEVDIIEYSIDGGNFIQYTAPFDLGELPAGSHSIRYRVRDKLGNISEEKLFVANLVDIVVKRQTSIMPRVLVFMLQTHDLRKEDPKPNENLVRELETELGGYMKFVSGDHNKPATVDEFISELRTDKYNIFVFATDAFEVNFYDSEIIKNLFKEIKSRLYKGDSFISMIGYSATNGQSWHDFISGFDAAPDQDINTMDGMGIAMVVEKFGRGLIVKFGGDVGRIAELNPTNYESIKLGLAETIRQLIPSFDELNAYEVIDHTLTFENRGDIDVRISVNEQFPDGWIETAATKREESVKTRSYEITVSPHSTKYIDYLYRTDAGAGSYDMTIDLEPTWSNGISSRDKFPSSFAVERDAFGLVDKLIGPSGLIKHGTMPLVETELEMINQRLALDNTAQNDSNNELINMAIGSLDNMPNYSDPNYDEIYYTICELIENLGAMQTAKSLQGQFSISAGDPNDPASFHGDTSSSMDSGGGGCSIGGFGKSFIPFIILFFVMTALYCSRTYFNFSGRQKKPQL